ncbi:MAG: hypothetical protein APF76_12835 [Desulfitibacter sp. BRH_c19]|nr:MAG: hypothetical protein APF76_12835 [Desulfitibacter sp. BRH_c19]
MEQKIERQIPQWKIKMFEKLIQIDQNVEKTYIPNQVTDIFPPGIDIEGYRKVLKEVISLLKEYMEEEIKTLGELEEIASAEEEGEDSRLQRIFSQITIKNGSFELEQFTNPSYAKTVLIYSLKPFLKVYGKQVTKNNDIHEWKSGHCPVCGHNAVFARLSGKENGKRYLLCPLCETQWPFNRIACPFCLEKDPEKLGYFKIEEEKKFNGYKVNFCLTCNGYIKTYDERSGSLLKDNILIEDAETSYLDYLAQKEGFQR